MVARATKATPERVDQAIVKLRREGRRVGWYDGAVYGTALIQHAIGGEGRRIRAMILLHSVDRGERVPAVEVARARQVLGLEELRPRRGPLPRGVDQVLTAAGIGDGTPVLERIARAIERVAAALEALAEEPALSLRAAPIPAQADPVPPPHAQALAPPATTPGVMTAPPAMDSRAPHEAHTGARRPMPRPRQASE